MKTLKEIFKKYWYYNGQWHDADCAFVVVDWGVCNCKTGKNNIEINEAIKQHENRI